MLEGTRCACGACNSTTLECEFDGVGPPEALFFRKTDPDDGLNFLRVITGNGKAFPITDLSSPCIETYGFSTGFGGLTFDDADQIFGPVVKGDACKPPGGSNLNPGEHKFELGLCFCVRPDSTS